MNDYLICWIFGFAFGLLLGLVTNYCRNRKLHNLLRGVINEYEEAKREIED